MSDLQAKLETVDRKLKYKQLIEKGSKVSKYFRQADLNIAKFPAQNN